MAEGYLKSVQQRKPTVRPRYEGDRPSLYRQEASSSLAATSPPRTRPSDVHSATLPTISYAPDADRHLLKRPVRPTLRSSSFASSVAQSLGLYVRPYGNAAPPRPIQPRLHSEERQSLLPASRHKDFAAVRVTLTFGFRLRPGYSN